MSKKTKKNKNHTKRFFAVKHIEKTNVSRETLL